VLEALSTSLEIEGVEHGAIETEQLSMGVPLLPASDWLPQLRAVLALQHEAGRRRFLVVATTEDDDQLRAVLDATHADTSLVVCLRAGPELVASRIDDREPDGWPGKAGLIDRARDLALTIPALVGVDLVLDTEGRSAEDLAREVREQMRSRGMLPPPSSRPPS
jgi:hypothetical protein